MNTQHVPCPVEDLQVSPISDHEWRVADGRVNDRSAAKVLGFIQRSGSGFDVLDITSPDRDLVFGDWKSAVEFFSGGSAVVVGERSPRWRRKG
jgi:hypothetical protein